MHLFVAFQSPYRICALLNSIIVKNSSWMLPEKFFYIPFALGSLSPVSLRWLFTRPLGVLLMSVALCEIARWVLPSAAVCLAFTIRRKWSPTYRVEGPRVVEKSWQDWIDGSVAWDNSRILSFLEVSGICDDLNRVKKNSLLNPKAKMSVSVITWSTNGYLETNDIQPNTVDTWKYLFYYLSLLYLCPSHL